MVLSYNTTQAEEKSKTINILLGHTNTAPYSENASGGILSTFNAAVLGQLIKTDKNFNLIPGHLESWEWDYQNSEYVLKIRKGLKFHNGREIKSTDLEFSLLRGFYSEQQSFYRTYLSNIKGVNKIKPGTKYKSGLVDGVTIKDEHTVSVKLNTPNPNFLLGLTGPYFSFKPIEELKDDYITWKSKPIGAGLYQVIEEYKDGVTKLKRIVKKNGFADFVNLYTIANDQSYDLSIFESPDLDFSKLSVDISELPSDVILFTYSNQNSISKTSEFKEFFKNSINKSDIVKDLPETSITDEILPKHLWGRSEITFKNNPNLAKSILENKIKTLKSEPIRICVFSGPKLSKQRSIILNRMQDSFKKLGVEIEFETTLNKFYTKSEAKRCHVFMAGMVSDYIDPLVMFSSLTNRSAYLFNKPKNDPTLEELYIEASNNVQKDSRIESLRKLSKYVSEKNIVYPLAENRKKTFYNNNTIKSLGNQNQPLTLFIDQIEVQ